MPQNETFPELDDLFIEQRIMKQMSDMDFSGMIENFYKIDRKMFLDYQPIEERLSSAYIDYKDIKNFEEFLETAVKFITRTAYGLFSYITEESNPNIILHPDSDDSFCGLAENIVQVGLALLTQKNISYQDAVDSCVALCYHEFYHKRFTVRDFKNQIKIRRWDNYYGNKIVANHIKKVL